MADIFSALRRIRSLRSASVSTRVADDGTTIFGTSGASRSFSSSACGDSLLPSSPSEAPNKEVFDFNQNVITVRDHEIPWEHKMPPPYKIAKECDRINDRSLCNTSSDCKGIQSN